MLNGKLIIITVMEREAYSALSFYQDISIDVLTVPPMCSHSIGVVIVKSRGESLVTSC